MKHTTAQVIDGNMIELDGNPPDDPANMQLTRNGKILRPGVDYNAAVGDESKFITRIEDTEWHPGDKFEASIDE